MSTASKCCIHCFSDPYLKREVYDTYSGELGTCPHCSAPDTPLIFASDLKDKFEMVSGIYVPEEGGSSLLDLLQQDWAVFNFERVDTAKATLLLAEILDDPEVIRTEYAPSENTQSETLDVWHMVRTELKHQNRFFPKTRFDLDRIEQLLPHLQITMKDITTDWHRARIQDKDAAFSGDEMGAPPKDKATHGRANPAGIPYLYLASNLQTAASEIRPHPGEVACVAAFTVPETLSLVDLRWPRVTVSPFSLSSEDEVAQMRGDIDFLEYFGEELTRPVVPQAAAIDYIPSQYLCEFIKDCRYDGVLYRSSVGDGINLALFEPEHAAIGEITSLKVNRVIVELAAT